MKHFFNQGSENEIKKQQGEQDRELFENHLMGYTLRSEGYRLVVVGLSRCGSGTIVSRMYDHRKDPTETNNIAEKFRLRPENY